MTEQQEAIQLLVEMNQKMDRLGQRFDQLERDVSKKAIISGATAGAISGGIVAACIVAIKAKIGL